MDEEKYFNEVKHIEKQLRDILGNSDFSMPKPTNSISERKKFFKAYADDKVYYPQFEFEKREYDPLVLKQLENFKINTRNDPYGLKRLIKKKLKEKIYAFKCYMLWGKVESTKYAILSRGKPSWFLLREAKKYCLNYKRKKFRFKRVSAETIGKELKKEVKRLTGENIKVKFMELPNKVNISPKNHIIRINKDEVFTTLDIERLKVHEIGTHFMRFYNAKQFNLDILESGTANYQQTEEGLAVYMEELKEVSSVAQMYLYAGRVIATYYTDKKDFYELFELLKKYGFKDQDAFTLTFRAKRNICDTSNPGGYTKDYVYFKGYADIKKYVKKNDLRNLFIGKIKIEDLTYLKKFIKKNRENIKTIIDESNLSYQKS